MAGSNQLFLEKMSYTHYVIVENLTASFDSKSFGVCLERGNYKDYVFIRHLRNHANTLPQSLSVIEPSKDFTHRVRLRSLNKSTLGKTFRVFSVSLPGYSSQDIARELYKFCMGGKDPKW